jgi:hypothetical protein
LGPELCRRSKSSKIVHQAGDEKNGPTQEDAGEETLPLGRQLILGPKQWGEKWRGE